MEIDENDILTVKAVDRKTRNEGEIAIPNDHNRLNIQ
jgi:molecular chaperone DnaK (HSP70)